MSVDKIAEILKWHAPKTLAARDHKPAAVLVPIQERSDGAYLVLTRRATDLRHHSGQVAFPGGRIDDSDADEIAAALRESHEEIGIRPEDVRIIGRLDQVRAAYDFVVTPFVGVIPAFCEFHLNPAETAAVVSMPVAALLEPANFTIDSRLSSRGEPSYRFQIDDWNVWGVTARIIVQFLELVYDFKIAHP
jgi:8-oxo-dGTP pyrophosphatase MutT (NUDIX family)